MTLHWINGVVCEKKVWKEGLFTLRVKCDGVLPFEPGQFLHLGVFYNDQHVHRPYSVASPHGQVLEFYIVLVEDGELTPRLWQLDPGGTIHVSQKPAGSFTLEKVPECRELWLVATGTGLAPYVAMLRTEKPWQRFEKIVVVHGVRFVSDLSYAEEMLQFEKLHGERFAYVPTATRDSDPRALHGRIPQLLASGELEEKAGTTLSRERSCIMLCGNPAMLDDMEQSLASRQMKRHRSRSPGQIIVERYW